MCNVTKGFATFVLLLYMTNIALCQSVSDTILIDQVTVTPLESVTYGGEKSESFDSLMLKAATYKNLGDFLSQQSNVIIKSYGTEGMASSLSLRGAGSSRTQILWEGLSLNSISSGDNNLSLVPVASFDNISINYNASAAGFGSGTFGGAINLKSTPNFTNHVSVQALASIGSFHTYKTNIGYSVGAKKIHYKGSFFYTQSASDFEYYDYILLDTFKRKNADYFKYGTIQNVHVKITDKLLAQAALWYQVNDANLPSILGTTSKEVQYQCDSSLRALATLRYTINSRNRIVYKTVYTDDFELYTKKTSPTAEKYSEYSEIKNKTNIHILQYVHKQATLRYGTFFTEMELQEKLAKADLTNYGGTKKEYSTIGVVQINHLINFHGNTAFSAGKMTSLLSVRKEFNSQYSIPFIAHFGSEYQIAKGKGTPLTLRFSVGNKYRTPTFNDLYWIAWGNPELLPEYGFSTEFGIRKEFFNPEKWYHLASDVTFYHSVLNDMIMWTPCGAVWHPLNTAQAVLQGLEFSLEQTHKTTINKTIAFSNKLQVNINNPHITKTYDTTSTTTNQENESVGHVLYYVPRYAIHFQPRISYGNWECSFFVNYESERYYNLEKTLDSYITFDARLQRKFVLKHLQIVTSFIAQNITNTVYEQIRSYPLPGRNFEGSLQIIF